MSKIIGKITKKIYLSDNNYGVYLFKVRETDLDKCHFYNWIMQFELTCKMKSLKKLTLNISN